MKTLEGKVILNKHLGENFYEMEISCPHVAEAGKPGQFVMVKYNPDSTQPLLGRPFGIAGVDKEKGSFSIVYQVVGCGTKALAKLEEGFEVEVAGPLGHGFTINEEQKNALVIAGGIGVAPLIYLAKELCSKNIDTTFIYCARSKDFLVCADTVESYGCKMVFMTDDGSVGTKGYVNQILPDILANEKFDMVYTCGRNIMMQKVAEICDSVEVPCEVSLEEHMGCGIGICMGCVCDTKRKDGVARKERVCYEGPVFSSKDVVWHE